MHRREAPDCRQPEVEAHHWEPLSAADRRVVLDRRYNEERQDSARSVLQELADDLRELYAAQHTETVTKKERARLARSRAMARYPAEDADLVIVTPGPNPGPVSKYIDNDVFHAALAAVDVSAIGRDVHAARHTAATNLVAAGVPLTTVRKRLGHSSLAVTQRYVTTGGDAQEAGLEMLELHLARALRE